MSTKWRDGGGTNGTNGGKRVESRQYGTWAIGEGEDRDLSKERENGTPGEEQREVGEGQGERWGRTRGGDMGFIRQ